MIKKYFSRAVVTALFVCSFAQAALATTVRSPEDAWVVRPIATKKDGEPGYCSMKNHFKDGPTLILARDTAGSNAIALDFHKDMFNAGIRYNVKATAGSVTRTVDALAASKQVLLMKFGVDVAFYDELARKHAAVFTAGKNTYSFNLDVSAADALVGLGHCSASLQTGLTFTEVSFPLGTVHAETMRQFAENIDANIGNKTADGEIVDAQPVTVKKQPQSEQARVEVKQEPSPAQVDTVREDMKAEIASEILSLRAKEEPAKAESTGPAVAAMPVDSVEKSPLEKLSASMEKILPEKKSAEAPTAPSVKVAEAPVKIEAPVKAVETPVKIDIVPVKVAEAKVAEAKVIEAPVKTEAPAKIIEITAKTAEETSVKAEEAPVKVAEEIPAKTAEVKTASVTPAPVAAPVIAPLPLVVPSPVKEASNKAKHVPAKLEKSLDENTAANIEPSSGGLSDDELDTPPVKQATSRAKRAPARLTEENDSAIAENIELKSRLSQAEKERAELANNVGVLKTLAGTQAELASLARTHDQTIADLQSKLHAKEKEALQLKAELDAKDKDFSAVKSVAGHNSSALANAQTEIANLKREHDEEVAKLKNDHDTVIAGLRHDTEQAFVELQSKLDAKEKQSEELEAALNAKDKDLTSVKTLSSTDSKALEAAKKDLAATQAEIASLKHDRDQAAAALQAKVTEKTAQYEALKNQNAALAQEKIAQAREKEAAARVARATPAEATPVNAIDDIKSEIAAENVRAKIAPQRAENIDLKGLLLSSRVLSSQEAREIKISDNGNALHWNAGGLFGSAQQLPLSPGKSLTDTAGDYLHKTASLCKGDFGQKMGQVSAAGKYNVLEADITCIDGQNTAAAAVLFVSNQGMFSVITQEGTVDQLHTAMTNRDALISAALGNAHENAPGNLLGNTEGSDKTQSDFDTPSTTRPRLLQNDVAPLPTVAPVSLASSD